MNLYLVSFDLKPGIGDVEFTEHLHAYLQPMMAAGAIANWRLVRRKLGFGHVLSDFLLIIETETLAQLDAAFTIASRRDEPIETLHWHVNRWACNLSFSLYRDFPDAHRVRGQEKF